MIHPFQSLFFCTSISKSLACISMQPPLFWCLSIKSSGSSCLERVTCTFYLCNLSVSTTVTIRPQSLVREHYWTVWDVTRSTFQSIIYSKTVYLYPPQLTGMVVIAIIREATKRSMATLEELHRSTAHIRESVEKTTINVCSRNLVSI